VKEEASQNSHKEIGETRTRLPDERVVYLAPKIYIFKGPNGEIRQIKAIRRLIINEYQDAGIS
jgi:hypothetical protein